MNQQKLTIRHLVEKILNQNQRSHVPGSSKDYLIEAIDRLTEQLNNLNDDMKIDQLYADYINVQNMVYSARVVEFQQLVDSWENAYTYLKQHAAKFDNEIYKMLFEEMVSERDEAKERLNEYHIQLASQSNKTEWLIHTKLDVTSRLIAHQSELNKINKISSIINSTDFTKTAKFLGMI